MPATTVVALDCPDPRWVKSPAGDKCYLRVDKSTSQALCALCYCRDLFQASLPTIMSWDEQATVWRVADGEQPWIGLYRDPDMPRTGGNFTSGAWSFWVSGANDSYAGYSEEIPFYFPPDASCAKVVMPTADAIPKKEILAGEEVEPIVLEPVWAPEVCWSEQGCVCEYPSMVAEAYLQDLTFLNDGKDSGCPTETELAAMFAAMGVFCFCCICCLCALSYYLCFANRKKKAEWSAAVAPVEAFEPGTYGNTTPYDNSYGAQPGAQSGAQCGAQSAAQYGAQNGWTAQYAEPNALRAAGQAGQQVVVGRSAPRP